MVNKAMGLLAEKTAVEVNFKITREQADEHACRSYERSIDRGHHQGLAQEPDRPSQEAR